MKRLAFLTLACVLLAFIGCQQSAESRYQRYLEEVADTSGIEFITPEEDPVEYVEDNLGDPFADDGGVITVPDIPQQHEVSRYGSNYEVEKVMMGKE
jgi:Tfp pilus assembly protein PilP